MTRTKGSTFGALLETAPDAMLAVDSRGRVVLANAQVEIPEGHRECIGLGPRPGDPGARAAGGTRHQGRHRRVRTGSASLSYLKQFPNNTHRQRETAIAQLLGIARNYVPSQEGCGVRIDTAVGSGRRSESR
jgi:hypothetical protein